MVNTDPVNGLKEIPVEEFAPVVVGVNTINESMILSRTIPTDTFVIEPELEIIPVTIPVDVVVATPLIVIRSIMLSCTK